MNSPQEYGRATAWATRWSECARPGCYVVTMCANPGAASEWTELHSLGSRDNALGFDFLVSFQAVMDNFGRLVRVQ